MQVPAVSTWNEKGNIWMTARKVLPVCQVLPTSGHLKRDLLGYLAVKRQLVNPRHPVNRDVAQILTCKLPRLLKDPKVFWFQSHSSLKTQIKLI